MAKKYVKCGVKALSFSDTYSDFSIAKGEIKELVTNKQKRSVKIKNALRGGHLETVSKEDFKNWTEGTIDPEKAEETLREILEDKTKANLINYYDENFDLTDEELTSFGKLNKDSMIEEIIGASEEEEED